MAEDKNKNLLKEVLKEHENKEKQRDHENENDLKKQGIYIIKNKEELENCLEKGIDADFIVFTYDFTKDKEFKDIESIIESLPGRIIVIGNEGNKDEIIKKRVAFVKKEEDFNCNFNLDPNPNNINNPLEEFKLKLYDKWIEHLLELKNAKSASLTVDLKGEGGGGTAKIENIDFLVNKIRGFIKAEYNKDVSAFVIKLLIILGIDKKWKLEKKGKEKIERIINLSRSVEDAVKLCKKELKEEEDEYTDLSKRDDVHPREIIAENMMIYLGKNDTEKLKVLLSEDFENKNSPNRIPYLFSIKKEGNNNGNGEKKYILYAKDEEKQLSIVYQRHQTGGAEYYHESLSGSSEHFVILESILTGEENYNYYKMLYQLIENGLIRILVADERIMRYAGSNENVKTALECAGVYVVQNIDGLTLKNGNEEKEVSLGDIENVGLPGYTEYKNEFFDFFIIHQGILDKIQEGQEKRIKMDWKKTIREWKNEVAPFVIVTSGRGRPVNVPENAKFLPFSVVEKTLITPYHSKFILTQMLFRVKNKKKAGNKDKEV